MAYTEEQYKDKIRKELGDKGANSVFELVFPKSSGGTWVLSFAGASSSGIGRFSPVSDVRSFLEAVDTIGVDNVDVHLASQGYLIEFKGALSAQNLPKPEIDASGLVIADGEPNQVSVLEKVVGKSPFLNVDEIWDAFSIELPDTYQRFLVVRCQAALDMQGIVWTQIDQQTGDERRDYEKQFEHLKSMIDGWYGEALPYLPQPEQSYEQTSSPSLVLARPVNTTPNGQKYGCFGFYRWRNY